ncbi:MAG TPA: hypothetical protein VE818_02950 [Nitrososphaeraceae archaeon]|nr:hypothetical protein [Nitrososphaeraceae archaeon]
MSRLISKSDDGEDCALIAEELEAGIYRGFLLLIRTLPIDAWEV